jgi:two-component system osmolarity sensor histidine kinase EnvZ
MNYLKTILSFFSFDSLTRGIKRFLPRSLFGRTLLIIVTPTILALCVATFVFFDRHWYTVTNRLTNAAAGDIAVVVEMMRQSPTPEEKAQIVNLADEKMDLFVSFEAGNHLAPHGKHYPSPLRELLKHALEDRVPYPTAINMRHASDSIAVRVETPEGVYMFLLPERRIYTPTTEVFIGWMVGSSILLSIIALLFMRNQIRPIRRLAAAAEAIGKGQDVPWFKQEGSIEVRQAGAALMLMNDRLRRQIAQRTAMLAGVSHDLRTPLTRMKLQLALMPESQETRGFKTDIEDMEGMVEAYLSFVRGDGAEPLVEIDLDEIVAEIVDGAKRQKDSIHYVATEPVPIKVRRQALKRCLANLVGNALRYGTKAEISVARRERAVDIFVDDNGPGIAREDREAVFRPFLRLDESRNPETGGVGLGLTIARDIARMHGGDIVLENAPLSGLRAHLWLPL